jgi:non-ribosomal peptide synthase protein (TIGR01720 family)
MFPVALDVAGSDEGVLLKATKEQLRAVPNRGIGYGVLRYLGDDEVAARLPGPAPVSFNYLGRFGQEIGADAHTFGPGAEATGPDHAAGGSRAHVVDVNGGISDGRLQMSWVYSANLHERATIERVASDFVATLHALIAHCAAPEAGGVTPSDFPLAGLDQSELDELVQKLAGN